jgi:hypothetical protein
MNPALQPGGASEIATTLVTTLLSNFRFPNGEFQQ